MMPTKNVTVVRPLMCLDARLSAVLFSRSFILSEVLQNASRNIQLHQAFISR